ncbi:MAG: carbohydrate binding family 9 domain-containing protein [Balneolales bacterium]|nr:carbohydrate binding family 9 domain-containing protein [Balneolales bacterium]
MIFKPVITAALLLSLCFVSGTLQPAQAAAAGFEGPAEAAYQTTDAEHSAREASPYEIRAYRLRPGETFVLDGIPDEEFWSRAEPATHFTMQEPEEGAVPSHRTEVFVAYDDDYLYIAAMLYDDKPEGILAFQKRRNAALGTDDRFMFILDTFNSQRTAYFFETNPNGLMGDGLLTVGQGVSLNKSWNGIWEVRTHTGEQGWSLEIRIPFRSLDFDRDSDSWGINFQRTVRRSNEEILWAGWQRNQGIFRPAAAGKLTGLTNLSQGLGLEVKPYVTGSGTRLSPQGMAPERSGSTDAGFDLSYSITPGIRASLTVNTDFAETEVDQRRINLTRFPLFFPEQRDFFLEGAGIFSFASASGVTPFFSRRIGLAEGRPVPVNAGLRVLGRTENYTLGLYQIRTGETSAVPTEDFTAARYIQNFGSRSSIGLIYTRRNAHDDQNSGFHTLGADLGLNTSRFLTDKNLEFESFFLWHNDPREASESSDTDRMAYGFRINFPNFPFYGHLSYRQLGEAYNPALGFTSRNGFRRINPNIGYTRIFENSALVRSANVALSYTYLSNLQGRTEQSNIWFQFLNLRLESGEQFWGNVVHEYEYLPFSFDLLRDGRFIIEEGAYTKNRFFLGLSTASFRKIVVYSGFAREDFWNGTRNQYEASVTLRPYTGINVSGSWNRDDISLKAGSFHTDLFRFTGNFDFTPFLAVTSIVQYDNMSSMLGLFNRLRWTIRPGSDLFLVYTRNWIQLDDRFTPTETQGAVKLNYTYRI